MLNAFLSEVSPVTIAAAAAGMAIGAVWWRRYRDDIALQARLTLDRLPVFGRVRAYQKKAALRTPYSPETSIVRAEASFVAPYIEALRLHPRPVFANLTGYLKKAEDIGVQPKEAPVLLTGAMVLAIPEGWSAGYVILPWLGSEMSAALRDTLAVTGGFALAGMFFFLAHWSGHLYRIVKHSKRHRDAWHEDGQKGNCNPPVIATSEDQSRDDHRPPYEQYFARTEHRAWWVGAPVVIMGGVIVFGCLMAVLRYVGLEEEALRAAKFAEEMAKTQDQEVKTVVVSGLSIMGNAVALGLFLLTFVAVQGIGFLAGARQAFNGARSAEVFKALRGTVTYEVYAEQREKLIAKLEPIFAALQAGLPVRGRPSVPTLREVIAFLEYERDKDRRPRPPPPTTPAVVDMFDPKRRIEPGGL